MNGDCCCRAASPAWDRTGQNLCWIWGSAARWSREWNYCQKASWASSWHRCDKRLPSIDISLDHRIWNRHWLATPWWAQSRSMSIFANDLYFQIKPKAHFSNSCPPHLPFICVCSHHVTSQLSACASAPFTPESCANFTQYLTPLSLSTFFSDCSNTTLLPRWSSWWYCSYLSRETYFRSRRGKAHACGNKNWRRQTWGNSNSKNRAFSYAATHSTRGKDLRPEWDAS